MGYIYKIQVVIPSEDKTYTSEGIIDFLTSPYCGEEKQKTYIQTNNLKKLLKFIETRPNSCSNNLKETIEDLTWLENFLKTHDIPELNLGW